MIVYTHPKCTTCKRAVDFLKCHFKENQYKLVDITKTPPSLTELKKMLEFYDGNIKKLFNTSGQLYRELNLTEKLKTMSDEDAIQLLANNGMLVKRPFLIGKDFGLVGFNEVVWEKILEKKII